ncbi:MAG: DUF6691 family protein [Saprospiraceae bacterium]|jgi:uncharacterized membrane protein YedE/YeeE
MKLLKFLLLGIVFGVIMTKSEAVSWYRIQEMFHFQSFHMYGIIGSAVFFGALYVAAIKRFQWKSWTGESIQLSPKEMSIPRYLFGGTIFGLGWAMTGACPGPMYTLVGHGYWIMLVVIASAVVGTWTYGMIRHKLPH